VRLQILGTICAKYSDHATPWGRVVFTLQFPAIIGIMQTNLIGS